MAGFGRVAFEGEYFNEKIVNVFWYRSTQWLPAQGNPFDDVLAFVDGVLGKLQTHYLACLPTDYTLERAVGVGYSDDFTIVTSSPLVRTVNAAGTISGANGMGAGQVGIISLRCGEQVQINGIGHTKRNRGYLCMGPVGETNVDNYSHLTTGYEGALGALAADCDDGITIIAPAVTLTPIRIHEKTLTVGPVHTLLWRTYSDVLGYTVQRVASYRRSRRPEA